MRITNVDAYPLVATIGDLKQAPVSVPRPAATQRLIFAGYRSLIVRIGTDEGLIGTGEGLARLAPDATANIVAELAPLVVGRDPRDVELIWEDLFATMVNRGHNRGFMLEAISAIDIALWDLVAQTRQEPLYASLGGLRNPAVPCYASSIRIKAIDEAVHDAQDLVRRGFQAIKLKIGRGADRVGEDIECVQAVRTAIGPSVGLMVDANCGYRLADAVRVGRALEACGAAWFEEPLPPDDLDGYRLLRSKIDVPLAAGETWFTRFDFREALVREAVDIVQPDVSRCGGISEARRIAWLASAFHCAYAPHTGQSSIVCLVASLHLALSMPNVLSYEYVSTDWSATTPNPLRQRLGRPGLETFFLEGTVPPSRPGLGLDIDLAVLEEFTVEAANL